MQKNSRHPTSQSPGGDGSTTNASHKKSLSGGLFSRFSFLRFSRDHDHDHDHGHLDAAPPRRKSADPYVGAARTGHGFENSSEKNASMMPQSKRKISLRKTALLGRGSGVHVKMDHHGPSTKQVASQEHKHPSQTGRLNTDNNSTFTRNMTIELGSPISSSTCPLPDSTSGASYDLPHTQSSFGEISTTEDEDNNNDSTTASSPIYQPSSSHTIKDLHTLSPPAHPSSTSYFPFMSPPTTTKHPSSSTTTTINHPLHRPHTLKRSKSPLSTSHSRSLTLPHAVTPPPGTLDDGEWDYTETEWWGWVMLITTWLVFVVGMGSCLGIWSWAWDVGETPYAPPELEDDPTLPIVGYYPALIILTTVMAWVWVVVAWIGMKYFRHAKISGEDL